MKISRRSSRFRSLISCITTSVILLCLALLTGSAEGLLPRVSTKKFNPKAALLRARQIGAGKVDPAIKVFNVLNFGAKADGCTNNAMAFIRTFKDACNFRGEAMMDIPPGNFLTGPVLFQGPCFNPSFVIVRIDGCIKAPPDLSLFPRGVGISAQEWITFQQVDGLVITGTGAGGVLDGQGAPLWKTNDCEFNKNCIRLPANLMFNKVQNTIIRGIKSVNPKGFHVFISNCLNFRLFDIDITAPETSPNTDGIHISKSKIVKISQSRIGTGDDCVSVIQGTTDISVKKVFCGPGHGFSIGSLGHYDDEEDVKKIVIQNCTMTGTDNGLRIKSYKDSGLSKAEFIIFKNICVNNIKRPIIIDQEYGNKESTNPSKVSISNVHFIDIRGTTRTPEAVWINCSPAVPCQGLTMKNINLKYVGELGGPVPFSSFCRNAKIAYSGPQCPAICRAT